MKYYVRARKRKENCVLVNRKASVKVAVVCVMIVGLAMIRIGYGVGLGIRVVGDVGSFLAGEDLGGNLALTVVGLLDVLEVFKSYIRIKRLSVLY